MKIFKQLFCAILVVALCFFVIGCGKSGSTSKGGKSTDTQESKDDNTFNIVSSFYPMHILAMNLTSGIDGVSETSMSEPNMGCIHDHTFTTDDLKKIEGANAYIENGLGLEAFNDQIKKAYPDTAIIEASKNVTDYVKGEEEDGMDGNAHVWTDLDNYILQVQYVSSELQRLNPENKDKYAANEKKYLDKLNQLKSDYADKLKAIEGKTVLVLDETLPNFCLYTKLDEMDIETDHEQESLSASDIKSAIDDMNEKGAKAILIAKRSDRKNAEAIANETGAEIYELNSCMVGDVNAEAYINDMKENFEIISGLK